MAIQHQLSPIHRVDNLECLFVGVRVEDINLRRTKSPLIVIDFPVEKGSLY